MQRWESEKTALAKCAAERAAERAAEQLRKQRRAAERAAEQLRKQGEADSVAQRRADFADFVFDANKKAAIKLAELKSREQASLDEILLGDEIKKLSIAGAGFKQSEVVLFV